MKAMEVELISKKIVKPSSPTPKHLQHYSLSFIDQITPPVYNNFIYFYPSDGAVTGSETLDRFEKLEQTLSDVLVKYYPLAGRLKGNLYVDCNDEGVPYKRVQVKCKISHVLENPEPEELKKLIPFVLDDAQEVIAGVQFNVFECGGIAIGVCVSHKLGDGLSFFSFVKSWAAGSRGEHDKVCTEFVGSKLFPPKNMAGFDPSVHISKDNVRSKRFLFTPPAIEALKAKYITDENFNDQRRPSRVEVLSAFIWSRIVAATKKSNNLYQVSQFVNLRKRIDPPLPEYSFGNLYWLVDMIPSMEAVEHPIKLVTQMREAINKVDEGCLKMIEEGDELLASMKKQTKMNHKDEMMHLVFTSLCWFPTYEADFGWGKPVWAGFPCLTFKNFVVFRDTVSGKGIEAVVQLKEEDMEKFQKDKELLEFVTPTM